MLPAVDLVLLIFLFCNITLDRVCYSVGSNAGKALLHLLEVPVYLVGGWLLCWNTRATILDRFHLRVCCCWWCCCCAGGILRQFLKRTLWQRAVCHCIMRWSYVL
jgi:hypothetical protein